MHKRVYRNTEDEAFAHMRSNFEFAFSDLSRLKDRVESFKECSAVTNVQFIVTESYPIAVILKITQGGQTVMRYMVPSESWLGTILQVSGANADTKVYLKVCLPKEGHRGTDLPEGTESWNKLSVLDVTDNNMKSLRVTELLKLPHFTSLYCEGNLRLFSPPPEIRSDAWNFPLLPPPGMIFFAGALTVGSAR